MTPQSEEYRIEDSVSENYNLSIQIGKIRNFEAKMFKNKTIFKN